MFLYRFKSGMLTLAGSVTVSLVLACAPEPRMEGASERLGSVDFPVSCGRAAQVPFQRGVALLHHMMYVEARREFEAVAAAHPECAMANWGIAMSLFQPMWPTRPSRDDLELGRSLLKKAREVGLKTERERAYVAAVEAFYADPELDYPTRLQRFEEGMARVRAAYPDDLEAAAFYALAHLSTGSRADKTHSHQRKAMEIVEWIHERQPSHPGAMHYGIHAHDVDGMATGGVKFAHSYDDIAPSVPHALHMPTHIFVRLGEWDEVIHWNRRSADAALDFPAGEFTSHHYPHAMDYLIYAYLQRAEDRKASQVLGEVLSRENYQPTPISAYALAAMPARHALERRQWTEAAKVPVRAPASFPWEQNPRAEAITQFARGIGAVRLGDTAAARSAGQSLEKLGARATATGDGYGAQQIDIQRLAVAAWTARVEGRTDDALELMRTAADQEDALDKDPVTPGAVLPARELLGDLLLEVNRPADALAAYEATLAIWPRRFNSLLGAARAADQGGMKEKARFHYTQLLELAADGAERTVLEEARNYLGVRAVAGSP